MADPTDVIERAQAWLAAADERGINRTDKNGYLAVIEDLVAEVEFQRTALQGYRNRQLEMTDEIERLRAEVVERTAAVIVSDQSQALACSASVAAAYGTVRAERDRLRTDRGRSQRAD